jgi:hypothetical protein
MRTGRVPTRGPAGRAWLATVPLVLIILAGCPSRPAPSGAPHGTPPESRPTAGSPSPAPPLPAVSRRLLAPPEDCPGPRPRPKQVSPAYGRVVGGGPLWGGFYADLNPGAGSFVAADAVRTEYGWRIKVLWIVNPDQADPVTLRGTSVSTGDPVWFEVEDQEPGLAPALDPASPGVPPEEGHWREFPSYLYFPEAACYSLEAAWPGGSWRLGFGFGG